MVLQEIKGDTIKDVAGQCLIDTVIIERKKMKDASNLGAMFGVGKVDTFLGLPACQDLDGLQARVAILGAPCASPYKSVGAYCAGAPSAIREAIVGWSANIQHVDFDLDRPLFADGQVSAVDCGDLDYDENDAPGNRARIRNSVSKILNAGALPIVLGGDDSIPIPVFEAFAGRGDLSVLQIDAHIDWRDEVQGERWGLSSTMRRASEMAHVTNIIQVGKRGIGSARAADYQAALDWGVRFFSAREVYRDGIAGVVDAVPPDGNVIISLDCDGLDPSVIPGVIGRAPGGLDYWQTVEIIHGVAAKANLVGFNIVEFMPERDVDALGALVCARIVSNVIGLGA